MHNSTKKIIIGVLIGIVAVLVIATVARMDGDTQNDALPNTETGEEGDTSTTTHEDSGAIEDTSEQGSISVAAQAAGERVELEDVSLDEPRWVAVHELNEDGARVAILGAARLRPASASGTIPLLRPTEQGSRYEVVIHRDNGDNDFDWQNDDTPIQGTGVIFTTRDQ